MSNTPCQSLCGESSDSPCVKCTQCWLLEHLLEPHACEGHKNLIENKNRTCQIVSTIKDSHSCSLNLDQTVESNGSSSRAVHVKHNEGNLPTYKSKRIKKGHHQVRDLEESTESQTGNVAADKNTYSCLTVDQGFSEEIITFNKVNTKLYYTCY